MKKLIIAAFIMAFLGTSLAIIADSDAQSPLIIRKKIVQHDPLLDYDFTAKTYPVPAKYNPLTKANPFKTRDEYVQEEVAAAELNKDKKEELAVVPATSLTARSIKDLGLTSVVVNHTFAYAFFTVNGSSKCYKAAVGDFLGKEGHVIANIKPGAVYLANGNLLTINR